MKKGKVETERFNTDEKYLAAKMFVCTNSGQYALSVNCMPDFLEHLKERLTEEQRLRLEEYRLQTYLIQLSVDWKEKCSFEELREFVLRHIRSNDDFWYKHNNTLQLSEQKQQTYHAIQNYNKHMQQISLHFQENDKDYCIFVPPRNPKRPQHYTYVKLNYLHDITFKGKNPLWYFQIMPIYAVSRFAVGVEPGRQEQLLIKLGHCITYLLIHQKDIQMPKDSEKVESNEQDDQANSEGKDNTEQFTVWLQIKGFFSENIKYPQIKCEVINVLEIVLQLLQNLLLNKGNTQTSVFIPKQTQRVLQHQISSRQIMSLISELSERLYSKNEISMLRRHYQSVEPELQFYRGLISAQVSKCTVPGRGYLQTAEQVKEIKEGYLQMLEQPAFVELTKYKTVGINIPWTTKDYQQFLERLKEYINYPTNNKKIASYMGRHIEPNHVKYIKGIYLSNIKERIQRGECGGGKRGRCLSKLQFLERDIANFNMKYFEKTPRIKKRKLKRRRRDSSDSDNDEVDSEY